MRFEPITQPAFALGVALSSALWACGGPPAAGTPAEAPVGRELTIVQALDSDPDPDVLSTRLTAAATDVELVPGHPSPLLTFDGVLPGPLIRAKKGDRLVIELDNQLDEPTTIHWHGMRVPNEMDGVPDVTQPGVAPGERFVYDFVAPDAGLFWYHPHYDTVSQVGNGLYGAVLIEDPAEPELGDEVVMVLSDADLSPTGEPAPEPDEPLTILAGREGAMVLVNGIQHPALPVREGRRQRWRVVNAARSRYFRLALAGHAFLQIGGDGGRLESPRELDEPVLGPGERADLLVEPHGEAGSVLELMALPFSRGTPLVATPAVALAQLQFGPPSDDPSPPLPDLDVPVKAIDPEGAVQVPLVLGVTTEGDDVKMSIDTGTPDGMLHAKVGETDVLEIQNASPYHHPFHLHGYFFEALDDDGQPRRPLELKDTIDMAPLATERVVVHYDDRPGAWMFHCHILDHAEAGMMSVLHVTP